MNNIKAIIDLSVIPEGWDIEEFIRVVKTTNYIIVDTTHYDRLGENDLGVQILDKTIMIKDIGVGESRRR